ncbi:MAG: VCBS repeat-containing protein [Deltaproteobacteria bacterium]|nr:VCBS repeat-containing protein [Deltaproteobacteria bacterium]
MPITQIASRGLAAVLFVAWALSLALPGPAWARQTIRASVALYDAQPNGTSTNPQITPDGRYVFFRSTATNLVPGDTNGRRDVFRKDRANGAIVRVSVAADGTQGDFNSEYSAVSADGRRVAFTSLATTLVPGDTNNTQDIFLKDMNTGGVTRVSVDSSGNQANGASVAPSLAANTTYVAFGSQASNLVFGDTNGFMDVFVNGPFLEDATEAQGLELITYPHNPWAPNFWQPHTGATCARSGAPNNDDYSYMGATVTGPGVLSFWWKVSSQAGADLLTFYVDGVPQAGPISGLVAWNRQAFSIPPGTHDLSWVYTKDSAGAAGDDLAYVDEISYAASPRRTMYRAYNPYLLYHFFTTRASEFTNAVAAGYQNESSDPAKLFYVSQDQVPGTVALHRLYNPNSGRHYYTKNNAERDALVAAGWNFERDEGYLFTAASVAPADTVEVFRLYHPVIGTHLYTKFASEAAWVVANLPPWEQQTSLGWAFNSLTVGARVAAENTVSPDSSLLRAAAGQMGVDLASLPAWQALLGDQTGAKTGATAASATDRAAGGSSWLAGELGLGGEAAPSAITGTPATGQVQAWRDFDGDGADDLVWADSATGQVSLVLMSGDGPRELKDLGRLADLHWQMVAVADLNGDGGPDIAWWNPSTREAAFWLLTGTTVTARPVVGRAPEGAVLAGVGDFNGDGRVDLAWREAGGAISVVPAP